MTRRRDAQLVTMQRVLRALADPTRLRILGLLVGGEVCVCHIHDALRIPQPTASRHLAYLRRTGLVEARKDGLWVHYRLTHVADGVVRTLVNAAVHCAGHVATVTEDRRRLARATGCLVVPSKPDVACCAVERH